MGQDTPWNQWGIRTADDDGGYIISGGIYSSLIKTDSLGNEEWDKFSNSLYAEGLQQTSDGGYIITGMDSAKSNVTSLIKVDALGNEEWSKPIGVITGVSIQQTSDNGYIIAENTMDGYSCLLKTDANGNV
jgi:hypothetical protein